LELGVFIFIFVSANEVKKLNIAFKYDSKGLQFCSKDNCKVTGYTILAVFWVYYALFISIRLFFDAIILLFSYNKDLFLLQLTLI
jgi:hypothetical protein